MPDRERQYSVLEEGIMNHTARAEEHKNQKNYPAAIVEYSEVMKHLKAAWMEKQFQNNSILNMFQTETFDNQEVTKIKLNVAECYVLSGDLENAQKVYAAIDPAFIKDIKTFNQQKAELAQQIRSRAKMLFEKAEELLSSIGEPVSNRATTEQVIWIEGRARVNAEARRLMLNPRADNASAAFNIMHKYQAYEKYLTAEERSNFNRLADAYDQFDAGRHPMAGPGPRL